MRKILAIVISLFYFFAIDPAASAQPSGRAKSQAESFVVKTQEVKKQDFTVTLDYIGSIKAKDEASVFSKVPGKLVEYTVNEGDAVRKAQVVANIDRDETGLKFELAKVESPIDGVLARILLDKGATIDPNKTVLAIVVNMDEMVVRLSIPEQDIPYMKTGLTAILKVDAYPQEEFKGKLSRVAEIVDQQTRTLPIEITFENKDHRLKSGMFARIKIIAAFLKDVLVLNQDAIVQELGERFVFVVKDDTANKVKVKLGRRDNGQIEILDGLRAGEQVIVFGQQGLRDGNKVTINNN